MTEPKTKHTPGPWRLSSLLSPDKPMRYASIYNTPHGRPFDPLQGDVEIAAINVEWANEGERRDICHANARLIAAAPELLNRLKWLIMHKATKTSYLNREENPYEIILSEEELIQLKTALSRAEGGE